MDFSFLDNEDFGLAKSFSTAPLGCIAPQVNMKQKEQVDLDKEYTEAVSNSCVTDGFCFKLYPGENVSLNQIIDTLLIVRRIHEITQGESSQTDRLCQGYNHPCIRIR